MNKYFSKAGEIQDHQQVIYPQCSDEIEYIWGYKRATEILIESIKQHRIGSFHDDILFPLLFLYTHLIELILKHIIRVLCRHKDNGCPYMKLIEINEKKIKKVLKSHTLNKLIEELKDILSGMQINNLHFFSKFSRLAQVAFDLSNNDINSITMRFSEDLNGEKNKATSKQIGLNLYRLHYDIISVIEDGINYSESNDFIICAKNFFDKNFIIQLNDVQKILRKYHDIVKTCTFETYFKHACGNNEDGTIDSMNFEGNARDRCQLKKLLNNYSSKEKTAIVYGLYFGSCGLAELGSVDNFNDWSEETKNIKILEKTPTNLESAITEIDKHLAYLNKYVLKSD